MKYTLHKLISGIDQIPDLRTPNVLEQFNGLLSKSPTRYTGDTAWGDGSNKNIFIIDDNMYYRSMRYEYCQLAREYEVGFAQIHMECSETVACKHNLNRPSPLPEDIITKMSLRMQKPDGNTAWEKLHIIIPTGELDTRHSFDFQRSDILKLVDDAMKYPVKTCLEDELGKEEARVICSSNVIHQSDQILRKLIAEHMKHSGEMCSGQEALKHKSRNLNMQKTIILDGLRKGAIIVPGFVEGPGNSATNTTSVLYKFIQELFEQMI